MISIGLDIGSISVRLAAVGRADDAEAFKGPLTRGGSFRPLPLESVGASPGGGCWCVDLIVFGSPSGVLP